MEGVARSLVTASESEAYLETHSPSPRQELIFVAQDVAQDNVIKNGSTSGFVATHPLIAAC
jgi:hypothetical protein